MSPSRYLPQIQKLPSPLANVCIFKRALKSTALLRGAQKNPSRLLHCQVLRDVSSSIQRMAPITNRLPLSCNCNANTHVIQAQRLVWCACVIRPSRRLRPRPILGLTRVRVLDWSFQLRLRPSRHTSNRPRWCWRRKTTILAASMGPEDDLSSHMLHCPSTPSPAISCAWASGVAAGSYFGWGACPWGSSRPWLDIRATATIPLT